MFTITFLYYINIRRYIFWTEGARDTQAAEIVYILIYHMVIRNMIYSIYLYGVLVINDRQEISDLSFVEYTYRVDFFFFITYFVSLPFRNLIPYYSIAI